MEGSDNGSSSNSISDSSSDSTSDVSPNISDTELKSKGYDDNCIRLLVISAASDNNEEKLSAIKEIRKMLRIFKSQAIDEFIQCGIIPILIDCLQQKYSNVIHMHVIWIISYITCEGAQHIIALVEVGVSPILIDLLSSTNSDVVENAAFALINIIEAEQQLRDYVINLEIIKQIVNLIKQETDNSILKSLTYIIKVLFEDDPSLSIDNIKSLMPALYILINKTDVKIIRDTIMILYCITEGGENHIQLIVENGFVCNLVTLLSHTDVKVQIEALRIIGNIVSGTDEQKQALLNCNVLSYIPSLIKHNKAKIKELALYFLTRIVSENEDIVQEAIDLGIIQLIRGYLSKLNIKSLTQKQSIFAISNMTIICNKQQVLYLAEQEFIEPLCKLLDCEDVKIVGAIIQTLRNICEKSDTNYQRIANDIEKYGGLEKIENLRHHKIENINICAHEIIANFFSRYFSSNMFKTKFFYNRLIKYFENNIKLSLISKFNIIIITNDDKFYEFERNSIKNSLLTFSNDKSIIEKKINDSKYTELCYKGIVDIKHSEYHIIARTFDGKIYFWGSNLCGVSANKSTITFNKPELVECLIDKYIVDMSCGIRHTIVLTDNGEVYTWGVNLEQDNTANDDTIKFQIRPHLVDKFNGLKIKLISCGSFHSLALTEKGSVYSWGDNDLGQLGRDTGNKDYSNSPHMIQLTEAVFKNIACGRGHSLLLSCEGDIYVFGNNSVNELGIN